MSRIRPLGRGPLTGRGALSNPAGRFERRQTEKVDDGWYVEEEPDSVATSVEPDRARGIITTNDSPDLSFEYSINPYRGCEHGCIYCLAGDTPILMADGTTRAMASLKVGDAIYGTVLEGGRRRYVKTQVLARWSVIKPAYRIVLEDGTEVVAGGDHRFLTPEGWKFVTAGRAEEAGRPHLTCGEKLMGTGAFVPAPVHDLDYKRGYLCGLFRGYASPEPRARDGKSRPSATQARARLPNRDPAPLIPCGSEAWERAERWLREWRIETRCVPLAMAAGASTAHVLHSQAVPISDDEVQEAIHWPATTSSSWSAGFLGGIFDAAGSREGGVLRFFHPDAAVIGRIGEALRLLAIPRRLELVARDNRPPAAAVRVMGGLAEHLRFFQTCDPAIATRRDISASQVASGEGLSIAAIEPRKGAERLYDITTGTGDFIANGVVSHNCYARPSHAYLGLSAGIDFETRLFYKADAGKVLEQELAKPGYTPKHINIGANTDPYQPVERRLKVTRSILEVLAEARHPLSIITKSSLILRDLDLLAELARQDLVTVAISITTLDPDTKRSLEPRTAAPQARLRVLRELSAAGVPAGVMVAPVIPAITDHEMEAILGAAAEAGARWAGYVLLRLPYEVKDLFREWLAQHFPDRASHVMSLIKGMRGGQDNDPRFGSRMRGEGPMAMLLKQRFTLATARLGLNARGRTFAQRTDLFRPPTPPGSQLGLPF